MHFVQIFVAVSSHLLLIYFLSKTPGDHVLLVSPGSSRPLSWRPERTATSGTSTARSAASRRRPLRRRCGRTRSGRRGARRRSAGSRSASSRRPSRRRRRRGGSPRRRSGVSGCVSWRLTCWMRSLRSRTADVGRPLEYWSNCPEARGSREGEIEVIGLRLLETVLGISDSLERIRIRGRIQLRIRLLSSVMQNKKNFLHFFLITYPHAHYLQSLKLSFLLKFCVNILFCSTPLWEKERIRIRIQTSDKWFQIREAKTLIRTQL